MEITKSSKKKVLWVHNFPPKVAGGGGWMYNQLEFLQDEVDEYFMDNLRNPLSLVRHWFTLRKLARRYEIIHAQYGSAVGFITSRLPCRKILSLKGSDWYKAPNPSWFHRVRIFIGHYFTRISLPRFDSVIVMSDAMKREVEELFPNLCVRTVVDPIDLERFKPKTPRAERTEKRILFASVNVKNPIKRYELAYESVELLQERLPEVRLVVMSNIPHDKVCDFINETDVLLLTSTHEGWPNVVKEILACNKPFVSTKVGDLPKLASLTKSCFTVDDNPREISRALFEALHSEPEDLRQFVEGFDMKIFVKEMKRLYASVIS